MLRRSRPHLAQTWRRTRWKIFFGIRWGVEIGFTLCVYAPNAQNFMGNSDMHAKQKKIFTPDVPHPAPPAPKSGCWDRAPSGEIFFQKHHLRVFKRISATRASF